MKTPSQIGVRLKAGRLDKNLTQDELSDITGINRSTVIALELGTNKSTSEKKLRLFAKNLGMTYEYLHAGLVASETFDFDTRKLGLRLNKYPDDKRKEIISALNSVLDVI